MPDEPDYIIDITHVDSSGADDDGLDDLHTQGRRWLGIHFECCGVYARVYRNRQGTAYVGHCPRCSRPVRIRIGPDGHHTRFFRAW